MANVLVQESSLQAIASKGVVIREAVETYLDDQENCNSSGEPPDA